MSEHSTDFGSMSSHHDMSSSMSHHNDMSSGHHSSSYDTHHSSYSSEPSHHTSHSSSYDSHPSHHQNNHSAPTDSHSQHHDTGNSIDNCHQTSNQHHQNHHDDPVVQTVDYYPYNYLLSTPSAYNPSFKSETKTADLVYSYPQVASQQTEVKAPKINSKAKTATADKANIKKEFEAEKKSPKHHWWNSIHLFHHKKKPGEIKNEKPREKHKHIAMCHR